MASDKLSQKSSRTDRRDPTVDDGITLGDLPITNRVKALGAESGHYLPPFNQLLAVLGINYLDLQSETVTVPAAALLGVLTEALRHVEVDEAWYIERYPDVQAAILCGDTPSAEIHFRTAGYREGRLPRALPFNASYYFDRYKDLTTAFDRADTEGLRQHFETRGYHEGRAGVPEHFPEAERWRTGLSGRG